MIQNVGTRWESCKHLIDRLNREVNKGKQTSTAGTVLMVYLNYLKKSPNTSNSNITTRILFGLM